MTENNKSAASAPNLSDLPPLDWNTIQPPPIRVVSLDVLPDVWKDEMIPASEKLIAQEDLQEDLIVDEGFVRESYTVKNRNIILLTYAKEKTQVLSSPFKGEDAIAVHETNEVLNIAIADGNSNTVAGRAAAIEVAKFAIEKLNSTDSVPDINIIRDAYEHLQTTDMVAAAHARIKKLANFPTFSAQDAVHGDLIDTLKTGAVAASMLLVAQLDKTTNLLSFIIRGDCIMTIIKANGTTKQYSGPESPLAFSSAEFAEKGEVCMQIQLEAGDTFVAHSDGTTKIPGFEEKLLPDTNILSAAAETMKRNIDVVDDDVSCVKHTI